jgi:hypothetical protein
MRVVRLSITLAIPDDESADRLEQIKAAIRQAWPAVEIFDDASKPRATRTLDCRECGETFVAKRTDAIFCSATCRAKSSSRKLSLVVGTA